MKLLALKQMIFRFLGFLLLMNITALAFGQDVKTDTTEERMDEKTFNNIKDGYNYVVKAEVEELSMFKIDLLGTGVYLLSTFDEDNGLDDDTVGIDFLTLSFEKKWKPNWSWELGSSWVADGDELLETNLWAGTKYYYNMNRRILKGKSANNFSADYIGLAVVNKYAFKGKDDYGASLNVVYGIQRRLGKLSFLQFEIGFENIIDPTLDRKAGVDLYSTLQIGLAF